ncbi:MAG: CcdB family protein [Pseudomonadota bacterium]|nr:CcdB family protein [Pseudomonadota bacterium]
MAQYDLYAMPDGAGYLLDVQVELLEELRTRVVVPLLPRAEAPPPAGRLNPVFPLNGADHVMVTQNLAAVPVSILGKPVGSLASQADELRNALDMVFIGF